MTDDDDNIRPFKPKRGKPRTGHAVALLDMSSGTIPALHSGRLFRFDTFAGETLLMHPIPRPGVRPPKTWEVVDTTDVHVIQLTEFFEDTNFTKVNPAMVNRVVGGRGRPQSVQLGPGRAVGAARMGRHPSAGEVLPRCLRGASRRGWHDARTEVWKRDRYLRAVARCFFIGIVARIMKPGEKVDTMVVLEGEQGTLKSTLLRALAFDRDEWFSDSIADNLGITDARAHLRGKLIVELAELSQLKATKVEGAEGVSVGAGRQVPAQLRQARRDAEAVSAVCRHHEHVRLSAGSTGNRRFWPVRAARSISTWRASSGHSSMPRRWRPGARTRNGGCRRMSRRSLKPSRTSACSRIRGSTRCASSSTSSGRRRSAEASRIASSGPTRCSMKS